MRPFTLILDPSAVRPTVLDVTAIASAINEGVQAIGMMQQGRDVVSFDEASTRLRKAHAAVSGLEIAPLTRSVGGQKMIRAQIRGTQDHPGFEAEIVVNPTMQMSRLLARKLCIQIAQHLDAVLVELLATTRSTPTSMAAVAQWGLVVLTQDDRIPIADSPLNQGTMLVTDVVLGGEMLKVFVRIPASGDRGDAYAASTDVFSSVTGNVRVPLPSWLDLISGVVDRVVAPGHTVQASDTVTPFIEGMPPLDLNPRRKAGR